MEQNNFHPQLKVRTSLRQGGVGLSSPRLVNKPFRWLACLQYLPALGLVTNSLWDIQTQHSVTGHFSFISSAWFPRVSPDFPNPRVSLHERSAPRASVKQQVVHFPRSRADTGSQSKAPECAECAPECAECVSALSGSCSTGHPLARGARSGNPARGDWRCQSKFVVASINSPRVPGERAGKWNPMGKLRP